MESCLCSICGAKLSNLFAHRAHHFIEHATANKPVERPNPSPPSRLPPVERPNPPSRIPTLETLTTTSDLDENCNLLSRISLKKDEPNSALEDVDRITKQIRQITLERKACVRPVSNPDTNPPSSAPIRSSIDGCWVISNGSGKQFVFRRDRNDRLQHYKALHRNAKGSTCKECGKEFETHRQLNYHVFTEHSQKFFTCDICDQFFYENELLQRHIRTTHDNELRPHICQYCQKGFPSRWAMRSHERQHTNETPYRCAICNQVFREDASLKSHWKFKHITELHSLQRSSVKFPTKRPLVRNQPALISHHARLHQ